MNRQPTTFRAMFRRALIAKVVIVGGLLAGMQFTSMQSVVVADPGNDFDRGPTTVETLIAAHDCWTGSAPADVEIPGHVVVTTPAGDTVYAGARRVGQALEQVFDGAGHGLTVHAFCR